MKSKVGLVSICLAAASIAAVSASRAADAPLAAAPPQQWQAETVDMSKLKPKRHHPLVSFVKGMHKEIDYRFDEAAKDMEFVFSAQPIDPYDQTVPPPSDQPYEKTKLRMADGSVTSVVKFPDGSERMVGGAHNGAVLLPTAANEFTIKYPDGTMGKLVKVTADEYKLIRPDNSTTSIKKTASGTYAVANDKMNYPREAAPDAAGSTIELR